jgi:Transglycosylase SLT domain
MTFTYLLGLQHNKLMHKQLLNWKRCAWRWTANIACATAQCGAKTRRCAVVCAGLALALLGTLAQADVWGYIDDKGVAHFAADKADARYELYFKGGTSFDTKDGLPSAAAAGNPTVVELPRPVAVPKLSNKLIAFFDVSPNFKAVKHHLREASNLHKIDFELLQALIATESGFDTLAVSPKGAVGLMQLMPPTAQRYGVQADAKTTVEKKLTDPKTNIRAGSRYLRDLLAMFPGKPELALAAYNAGEGAVKRYGNKIPPFPETQNYVKTVMQIYTTLKPPPSIAQKLAENRQAPGRVRVELGAGPVAQGGATGRGNMVPALSGAAPMAGPVDLSDSRSP